MWYVFNSLGTCIGVMKEKPTESELNSRNAICVEHADEVNICNIRLANGVLVVL